MRSSRLNIAAIVAMAGIASAGGASVAQGMASGGQMPVISEMGKTEMGKTTGRPNRRAPGAHKAAHRAAMKLRRVKKHKARFK